MKKFLLYYLFIFSLFFLHQIVQASINIDSLESLADKSDGKFKVDILNQLSKLYVHINIHKANENGKFALELARKINYKLGEAEALINSSNVILNSSTAENLLTNYYQALEIYRRYGTNENIAYTLNKLSSIYLVPYPSNLDIIWQNIIKYYIYLIVV